MQWREDFKSISIDIKIREEKKLPLNTSGVIQLIHLVFRMLCPLTNHISQLPPQMPIAIITSQQSRLNNFRIETSTPCNGGLPPGGWEDLKSIRLILKSGRSPLQCYLFQFNDTND